MVTLARKVIRITAEDSPNVRWARKELTAGRQPSGRVVLPGVLSWEEYRHRRATWDAKRQAVGLDAIFYTGPELKLFPPQWLEQSADRASKLSAASRREMTKRTLGIDPAEGGDRSAFAVADRYGLLRLESILTPDTTVVCSRALALMSEFSIEPENVLFDRGGGGKEHADRMRKLGCEVRTVSFGQPPTLEPKRGIKHFAERVEVVEDRFAYKNRRAEMFGELSLVLDPFGGGVGDVQLWAIPGPEHGEAYSELRRSLLVFPRDYDEEGRLVLPAKHPKPGDDDNTKKKTLYSMLGRSPDEADAVALALHALAHEPPYSVAGVGG